MNFVRNTIKEEREKIPQILKRVREEKNITLEAISRKTSIKIDYLKHLENGEYSKLPSGIYEKTFLKKYAHFLGLDEEKTLETFEKEKRIYKQERKLELFSKRKVKKSEFLVFPKIIKNFLITLVILIFLSYIGFYLKKTFTSPDVTIIKPAEDLIIKEKFIEVMGQTDSKTQIFINNKQVLKDSGGIFKEEINLKKGINIITITAKNKYGKERVIKKQVLVE